MVLSREEIERIKAQRTLEARLAAALEIVPPEQLETGQLTELVCSERSTRTSTAKEIRRLLAELGLESRLGERFNVGRFSVLKYRLGGYRGNLIEAAQRWPKFKGSRADLRDNVSLPLSIGQAEARVLGIIWSDGYADQRPEGRHARIMLLGGKCDFDFYRSTVQRELKRMFNKEAMFITAVQRVVRAPTGVLYFDMRRPMLKLVSYAVVSWLIEDLGFPLQAKKLRLPWAVLQSYEQRYGFLTGIVAAMARPHSGRRLHIYDYREPFLLELAELASQLGYEPRWDRSKRRLSFERTTTRRMLDDGIITRDDHRLALELGKTLSRL